MRFATALVNVGYEPLLDTEYRGKRPDALIIAENKEIFIDVITPEVSEDAKQAGVIASTLAQKLFHKLANQTTPSRLEVYILTLDLHHLADEIAQLRKLLSQRNGGEKRSEVRAGLAEQIGKITEGEESLVSVYQRLGNRPA